MSGSDTANMLAAPQSMALNNAGLKLSDVKQVTVLFRAMTKGDEPLWNYH